jgi:hypothetical protein
MIRNAAAQDIVAFLGILEPKNWPECLMLLVNQLDDQDPVHQEVCPLVLVLLFLFFSSFGILLDVGCSRSTHLAVVTLASPWLCQELDGKPVFLNISSVRRSLPPLGV